MATLDPNETDAAPRIDGELITDPASTSDYGWYAEIELRGHLKRTFKHSDMDLYTEANLQRAKHYDPLDRPDDWTTKRCEVHYGAGNCGGQFCRKRPTEYEQALRELPVVDVYDDRLVVPLEVMEQLDDDPMAHRHYSDEFRKKVLHPILAYMPIAENAQREAYGLGTDYEGRHNDFQTAPPYHERIGALDEYETLFVEKPDPRPIYVRVPPDHPLCGLNQMFEHRKRDDRTLFGTIVARDANTGTGKTTLAIHLAKTLDEHGWTAEKATLDPNAYAEKFTDEDTREGTCLILDELEQAADNRRSTSHENVKLSHLWATMRYRQVYSLSTMPSASMIDKRMKELSDLYIVVVERGVAVVYRTKIDDTEGEQFLKRLHRVRWEPLDDDPEYQKLTEKKAERMENYAENYAYGDDEDDVDPDELRREVEKETRNKYIDRMYEEGYTQAEIGEVVGLDRSSVSRIINR